MTDSNGQRHVYLRQMAQGERTSLTVLASLVPPGARVLDLGTGSGALGAYLTQQQGCTVDGVTINAQEAALAAPGYRRIEVADLDRQDWLQLFQAERYDCIVCADVLEHLREPERTLAACRDLLAQGGRLLISVPNAGYCGLVADLLQGDFRYREEGLLDRTHLRFFTRRSLAELLAQEGYATGRVEPIVRALNESEFRTRFDDLPPAVARYLLQLPDASTYQLIVEAHRAGHADATAVPPAGQEPAQALFTVQLYCADATGYTEARKVTAAGAMGVHGQTLRLPVPPGTTRLRLDPADRPGFLHLQAMRLTDATGTRWAWTADAAGLDQLKDWPCHELVAGPWLVTPGLVLLHGDDPWMELPPDAGLLATLGPEARLELDLGWPMSADYFALAGTVQPLVLQTQALTGERDQVRAALQEVQTRLEQAQSRLAETQAALAAAHEQDSTLATALAEQQSTHRATVDALQAQAAAEAQALRTTLEASARQLEEASLARRAAEEQLARLRQRQSDDHLALRKLAQEKITAQRQREEAQQQFQQLADHLHWIQQSTVWRVTRPIVRAKMALDRLLGRTPPASAQPAATERRVDPGPGTVDVIVPVYRGLEDTRCCIESVISSQCQTPWRLVVLNDASPEPEVTQWLREAAAREPRMLLLENEQNLGFVGTVNRGMGVSDQNDVVLLNSDAEVANDWLDRMRAAAYRDVRVASVTPFSNNATICSYPRFCEANELPAGWSTAQLDRAFAEANPGEAVDVPTGVGFCMYIRRDCLREVGLFDVEEFGKGYGEENDFCRRAADAGWRNLHALDCFVRHAGGVSFGASKSQRELDAMDKLRRLHPTYERVVHDYVAADPPRTARLKADLRRVAASGLPVVLSVLHNRGGGTLRHVQELAAHLHGQAVFFSLAPSAGGAVWLELVEPGSSFRLEFQVPAEWDLLLEALRGIGIAHVHYHHLIGHHHDLVLGLARQLGVSWDFTAHDYYPMCPNISLTGPDDRYCGEDGSGACGGRCASNATSGDLPGWRHRQGVMLMDARAVLAPSGDVAARFARMWPSAPLRVAPHTDIPADSALPVPRPAAMARTAALKVAVLGGLSRIKGADRLEAVAQLAARAGVPIEFHLLGHSYRNLLTQPQAALSVHGAYQEPELPRLLEWLQPDLVWFPAQWPETYSYTLSACLEAGLPVVGPDLGAFPERLAGRAWSWVQPWDQPAPAWLAFFQQIRERHFLTGQGPEPLAAPALRLPSSATAPWDYRRDYLEGVRALPAAQLPESLLRQGKPAVARGLDTPTHPLKRAALSSLARLRTSPALSGLARAVPAHLQRRVKNWLLA